MGKKDLKLNYRAASTNTAPNTFNRESRSLEFIVTTEAPVDMYDWQRGDVIPEVLLAKSGIFPSQVPMLDSHDRGSTTSVVGSVRGIRVEDDVVIGTAHFSSVEAAEELMTKYEEGHMTDFSAGYTVNNVERVMKGDETVIGGRTWKGPVNVVTSWTLKEASCCPIGADANAKARNEQNLDIKKDNDMTEEERKKMEDEMTSLRGDIKSLTESIGVLAEDAKKRSQADENHKDAEQIRRDAIDKKHLSVKAERDRISEIDLIDAKASDSTGIDFEDIRSECIANGVSVADAYKRYMDRITSSKSTDFGDGVRIGITKDERDKSKEGAVDGLMIRAGVSIDDVQDKDTEFQQYSLLELARNRLRCFNEPTRGLNQLEIFERAMSTSDFDNILADVANKAMLEGFSNAEETYADWCDTSGRANDFRDHVFARASEAPSFIEVNPEGGEYEYGSLSDAKETVAVTDYGIIVKFTRKMMVNDDLSALADIREKLGAAAARKYGDLVYAVLTGNPTMGDGNSLWDASNHSNYITAGAVPSTATLNVGAAAMATQTDIGGIANLNIRPQFLLGPWALKGTIDALLHSTNPVVVGDNTVNPWAYLTSVYDARLDTANTAGWYMLGRKGMTVKLFTLNGNMTPMLETKEQWANDCIEFKSRITAAAKAVDWRGMFYNDGVT